MVLHEGHGQHSRRLQQAIVTVLAVAVIALGGALVGVSSAGATSVTPPTISGFIPTLGSTTGGTEVLIFGTHFTRVTSVKFGTTPASFTVTSSTVIVATTRSHPAGAVSVSVTSPGGTATGSSRYTYVTPPTISPTAGPTTGGTTVTITGSHLSGATAVDFGATNPGSTLKVTGTTVTVKTPSHAAGTVKVTVQLGLFTSLTASSEYTYVTSG